MCDRAAVKGGRQNGSSDCLPQLTTGAHPPPWPLRLKLPRLWEEVRSEGATIKLLPFPTARFRVKCVLEMTSESRQERLGSVEELEKETDLYRRLLDLGAHTNVEPFLDHALQLLVQVAGARRGAIRLWSRWSRETEPSYSLQRGLDDPD